VRAHVTACLVGVTGPEFDARDADRRRAPWKGFAAVFFPSLVLIASWSFAMPRYTGPDEPSHVVHAAGVVRGELTGTAIPHFHGWVSVRIPWPYAVGVEQDRCYQFSALLPASCEPPWPQDRMVVAGATYTGRYPPAYYAIVGVPTLVTSSVEGFYAMRLLSALLAAAFLGLAGLVVATWTRNRWLAPGMLLAATPMAVYSAAVVNPSALEISAALCLWVSGLALVREHLASPPAGLVAIVALSSAGLTAARAISPLWLVIIAVALVAVSDLGALAALLRRSRVVQCCLAGVAGIVVLSVMWTILANALELQRGLVSLGRHATALDVLQAAVKREGVWSEELVGVFGSHEVLAPLVTYVIWWVAAGGVALLAVVRGARRDAITLVGLGAVCVLAPIALQFAHARNLGIVWQGRYMLPVAMGIPLLGAVVLGSRSPGRGAPSWLAPTVFVVLPIAAFLAFAEALRRYAVGVDGPIVYLHPAWQPPGGVVLWLCVNLAATASLVAALSWLASRAGRSDERGSRPTA
jgi:hypothetical protein